MDLRGFLPRLIPRESFLDKLIKMDRQLPQLFPLSMCIIMIIMMINYSQTFITFTYVHTYTRPVFKLMRKKTTTGNIPCSFMYYCSIQSNTIIITHQVGSLVHHVIFINRNQKIVRIYDRVSSTSFPIGHINLLTCENQGEVGGGAGMGHVLLTNNTLNHGQYIMYGLLLPYGFGCIK